MPIAIAARGLALSLILILVACTAPTSSESSRSPAAPVTEGVEQTTLALWENLNALAGEAFLFGHQDSLAYGVQWRDEPGHSDVKLVSGDYPALYGWDIGHLERGDATNLDGVAFADMQRWMRAIYERGGVVTLSWHMTHPATGDSSWETDAGAETLLPGGAHHKELKAALAKFADFARTLTVRRADGSRGPMPLIFRPWHEHNGDWFWWGRGPTSEADYRELWRFTVNYLTEEQQLDNLLFAFSPDRSRLDVDTFDSAYLYGYPGDDYVDILGIDNYWDMGHPANGASRAENFEQFVASLTALAQLAEHKGKLAAMTEGGQDTVFEPDFYTGRLLEGLLANEWTRQIVYAQVWRNANRESENKDHFYVPYPGHPAEADFKDFYAHPATLFEQDLPELYQPR